MKQAFVLINAEIGAENEVLKNLESIPEVKEAHRVLGSYDIVARVEAETPQQLEDIVNLRVKRIYKVRTMLTMRCVR